MNKNDNSPDWKSNSTGWWYEYSDRSYVKDKWRKNR